MTRRLACWKCAPSSVSNEAQTETQILSGLQLSSYCNNRRDRTHNSLTAVVSLLLLNLKLLSIYCKAWFAKPSFILLSCRRSCAKLL